jgi:hypothetical protein
MSARGANRVLAHRRHRHARSGRDRPSSFGSARGAAAWHDRSRLARPAPRSSDRHGRGRPCRRVPLRRNVRVCAHQRACGLREGRRRFPSLRQAEPAFGANRENRAIGKTKKWVIERPHWRGVAKTALAGSWRGHQDSRTGLEPAIVRMHAMEKLGETVKTVFLASPTRIWIKNDGLNLVNFRGRIHRDRHPSLDQVGASAFGLTCPAVLLS